MKIIDTEALKKAVRGTSGEDMERGASFEAPAHVDHAKREYLAVLIDELGGDLARIARFWDRRSEKTLRKLVRAYGLKARLYAARERKRLLASQQRTVHFSAEDGGEEEGHDSNVGPEGPCV